MKNLLILYAKYNQETIKQIINIILKLDNESLSRTQNTYYGSIKGLLYHIIKGSWHYLNAIKKLTDSKYCSNLPDLSEIKSTFDKSINDSFCYFETLSGILLKTAESITDEHLFIKRSGIKIYNGRIIDISVWEYFLQHITHQIHHQGQLSQLLDELKIDHELGSIFPLIPDSKI